MAGYPASALASRAEEVATMLAHASAADFWPPPPQARSRGLLGHK